MTDTSGPDIGLVLDCTDPDRLAAQRVQDELLHEHGTTWILMADPEGNEFCVCDAGAGH